MDTTDTFFEELENQEINTEGAENNILEMAAEEIASFWGEDDMFEEEPVDLSPIYPIIIIENNDAYNPQFAPLFKAALNNDKKTIKKYIDDGGDINIRDRQNRSLLQLVMLKPNFLDNLALFLITEGIDLSGTVDIYKNLNQDNYDPSAPSPKDDRGNFLNPPVYNLEPDFPFILRASVLHLAYFNKGVKSRTFIKLLTDENVDVNITCDDGPKIIRFKKTIYPRIYNERAQAELYEPTYDLLKLPNTEDTSDDAVLLSAFSFRKQYQDGYAFEKASLLHYATYNNDAEAIALLCAQPNINKEATTNLVHNKHLISEDTIFWSKQGNENPEAVEKIASFYICDTEVECYRLFGVTPMHIAFRMGNKNVMRLLTKNDIKIDAQDSLKNHPSNYLALTMFENASLHTFNRKYFNTDSYMQMIVLLKYLSKNSWPHYQQLILGDGNFSYAMAYARKHPLSAKSLIVTDYQKHWELRKKHGDAFVRNMQELEQKGADINYGIDARDIPSFRFQRFKKIHFNFPHDGSDKDERTLPVLIYDFFKSASTVQGYGDTVYMALPQDPDPNKQKFREGYIYDIFSGSARNGYICKYKRPFREPGIERYPGYEHVMTKRGVVNTDISAIAYEYVFEKTCLTYEQILMSENGPSVYYTRYNNNRYQLYYIRENLPLNFDSSDEEDLKSLSADEESYFGRKSSIRND